MMHCITGRRLRAAWLVIPALAWGCAQLGVGVYRAEAPSQSERYCAWYGAADTETLYFGEAAFWSASRARGGDPLADTRTHGPLRVGRFDLRREKLLEALVVEPAGGPAGVWDVLPHPNGRVYFSLYFGLSGWVDPKSGKVGRFPELGSGLSELARIPDGTLMATRYSDGGAVVVFEPDGELVAEHPLGPTPGFRVAAKSLAFDPLRQEIWVNTDLLPLHGGKPQHDARILDARGRERLRIREPEIQFMHFDAQGRGYLAERQGSQLALRILPPGAGADPVSAGQRLVLDTDFASEFDFVQDIQPSADGGAVVTRWSGNIHRVNEHGRVASVRFPKLDDDGLYYSAVLHDGRLCATHCADVSVVCLPAP